MNFSGYIVGIIGLIITIKVSRKKMSISYDVKSRVIINNQEKRYSNLSLMYTDKEINSFTISRVLIWNSRNMINYSNHVSEVNNLLIMVKEDKGDFYILDRIFQRLEGKKDGLKNKRKMKLRADAYFEAADLIIEIDEIQHFTSYRLETLKVLKEFQAQNLGYNIDEYISYCEKSKDQALSKGQAGYRKAKVEFPTEFGRAKQRAYFDSIRDVLVPKYIGKPVLRISEMELKSLDSESEVKAYIENRVKAYI